MKCLAGNRTWDLWFEIWDPEMGFIVVIFTIPPSPSSISILMASSWYAGRSTWYIWRETWSEQKLRIQSWTARHERSHAVVSSPRSFFYFISFGWFSKTCYAMARSRPFIERRTGSGAYAAIGKRFSERISVGTWFKILSGDTDYSRIDLRGYQISSSLLAVL